MLPCECAFPEPARGHSRYCCIRGQVSRYQIYRSALYRGGSLRRPYPATHESHDRAQASHPRCLALGSRYKRALQSSQCWRYPWFPWVSLLSQFESHHGNSPESPTTRCPLWHCLYDIHQRFQLALTAEGYYEVWKKVLQILYHIRGKEAVFQGKIVVS